MTEGYIKYKCHWKKIAITIPGTIITKINCTRLQLIEKGYLGISSDGIGFGNISQRMDQNNRFFITGSATGGINTLDGSHFAIVETTDILKNQLCCSGLTRASSESMSHSVFYTHSEKIGAVIHIHNASLWTKAIDKHPTSSKQAEYGTPEMAFSIGEQLTKINDNKGLIVMGGHQDGLLVFGRTLNEAYEILLQTEHMITTDY